MIVKKFLQKVSTRSTHLRVQWVLNTERVLTIEEQCNLQKKIIEN